MSTTACAREKRKAMGRNGVLILVELSHRYNQPRISY